MNLEQRCRAIRLILSDVDGVLTDGGIVLDNQGIETKRFHVRDGMGIRLWQKAGYRFGLITHRSSQIVKMRAAELGIEILRQGIDDKLDGAAGHPRPTAARARTGLLHRRRSARPGGGPRGGVGRGRGRRLRGIAAGGRLRRRARRRRGAVRETIEMILKAQSRWEDLIQSYR